MNRTKIENLVTCLAIMVYVNTACTVHATIFSTGGKFRPISNSMELHALTQTTSSYAHTIFTAFPEALA